METRSIIFVFGQDFNDRSPASKMLKMELVKAGFKMSELEVLKDDTEFPDKGYVLLFGSGAIRSVLDTGVNDVRGTVCLPQGKSSPLCFPCFAPGYLYRKPTEIHLFRDDLMNARFWIGVDRGECIQSE